MKRNHRLFTPLRAGQEVKKTELVSKYHQNLLAVIPYVNGVSEWIRKACEKYSLKVGLTNPHSLLTSSGLGWDEGAGRSH